MLDDVNDDDDGGEDIYDVLPLDDEAFYAPGDRLAEIAVADRRAETARREARNEKTLREKREMQLYFAGFVVLAVIAYLTGG